MRSILLFALVACGASTLSGCSLSGLDDFDIPDCKENTECAPLNEEKGIGADSCEAYQCRKSGVGCELRPRDMDDDGYLDRACAARADLIGDGNVDCNDSEKAAHPGMKESCDGVDNDCDGVVDDGVAPKLKTTATLRLIGEKLSVLFGDATSSVPRITVSTSGSARTSEVRSDTLDTPVDSLIFRHLDEQNEADTGTLPDRCSNADGTETICAFSEAAVTAFGEATTSDDSGVRAIVAGINTSGCAHGQVRIGYLKGASDVVLHGPAVHSNIFEGVDVNEDGCTGASRGSGPIGATQINTAGLSGSASNFPQALSAWLAASRSDRDECTGSEVAVEVLGSWLEKTENKEDVHWTNGTNDGVPESLGTTKGDARPAILAVDDGDVAGYFVAYGASSGGIALQFVPRFAEPPEYSFEATEPRVTKKLGAALSLAFAGDAPADAVSLSIAHVSDSKVELGVTWLEGECAKPRSVLFEHITVDVEEGTLDEGDALVVAKEATRVSATSLATTRDLVTADFEHDNDKATDTGGYLVAWTAPDGTLKLARISSFTGDLVGKVVDMGTAAVGGPLLFDDDGPVLAAYSDAGEVLSGPALCK